MKTLTVRQPWASLILRDTDRKTIENRTWKVSYRGLLAIHSSQSWDREEYEAAWSFCSQNGLKGPPTRGNCPCGYILGVVRLTGIHEASGGPVNAWHIEGHHGWQMEDPRRLTTPIVTSGSLGLWTVRPPSLVNDIRTELNLDN